MNDVTDLDAHADLVVRTAAICADIVRCAKFDRDLPAATADELRNDLARIVGHYGDDGALLYAAVTHNWITGQRWSTRPDADT